MGWGSGKSGEKFGRNGFFVVSLWPKSFQRQKNMDKNKQFVITLNRELGSGGRTVGAKLAERLGVPFYDKAVIQALQEKYKMSVDEIERLKGRNHSWWAEFARSFVLSERAQSQIYGTSEFAPEEMPDVLTTAELFETEQEVLRELAAVGSCVIAGRSGFAVLGQHPNHLRVLIVAPMEQRVARVMRKNGVSDAEARKIIDKVDEMRERYMKKYAKTSRYDARNYDLVISMAGKTEDEVADLIVQYIG